MTVEALEAEERSKRRHRRWLLLGIAVAVAIILAIMVIVVYEVLANNRKSSNKQTTVETEPSSLVKYASWLLAQRDQTFGWPHHMTADAVVALTLATPDWCCNKADHRLTAQALEIEILGFILRASNDSMSVAKELSKYTIAAKALCMKINNFHGINLQDILKNQLNFYRNITTNILDVKLEHVENYMWLLLALTLTSSDVTTEEVQHLIDAQKQDGSFTVPGTFNVETTARYIILLATLRSQNGDIQSDIDNSLSAAVGYINSSLLHGYSSFGNRSTDGIVLQAIYSISNNSAVERTLRETLEERLSPSISQISDFTDVRECCYVLPAMARHSVASLRQLQCGSKPSPD